jgi:anti-sigma B factor antagonist
MELKKFINNGNCTLALRGRLDTTTSPQFQPELIAVINEQKNVTLDFTGLEYVSSAGLRVLAMGEKQAQKVSGSMTLVNVPEGVMEVFDITGFVDILKIVAAE